MPESKLPSGDNRASGCVLTRDGIRNLDRFTIDHGIASIDLMERAGVELSASILRLVSASARLLVLAGSGNNGGDGYVIARLLQSEGLRVTVAHIGRAPHADSECEINAGQWSAMGGATLKPQEALSVLAEPNAFDLIVDAMLGTGLDRAVEGVATEIIDAVNASPTAVFAVDIPSGLDADQGRALGPCIRADMTATIGAAKPGLFLADGPQWCGRIEVLDIGLATPRNAGIATTGCVLDASTVAPLLPEFERTIHKGNRGHVLIAGGSIGKSGAAVLAARAALRAGAGLVTIGVPATIAAAVDAMLPEAMTLALADDGEGQLARGAWQAVEAAGINFDVLAAGPGMGTGEGAELFVGEALQHFDGPIIFDADALNVLASGPPDLRTRLARRRARDDRRVILTPHPGEMARLVASDSATVQSDRAGIARAFAKSHEAVLLLKGAGTIVAEGGRLAFNSSGNPGMAAAGMGDVLTGITAALCTRIRPVYDAACAAAYIHGKAGDLAAARIGASGYFSGEVADLVPSVLDWLRTPGGDRPL
jgi:hydroxyethylthiazole kinase-like uncharacterized protein yjeF